MASLDWEKTGDPASLLGMATEGLTSTNSATRQITAILLARIGNAARPAVPALKDGLWNSDVYERQMAGEALQKIAPEELPPVR